MSFPLHLQTLLVMTVVITSTIAALHLYSWAQSRSTKALAWWGAAFALQAAGVGVLALSAFGIPVARIDIGNTMILASSGIMWNGIRLFYGKKAHWFGLLGAAVWLVLSPTDFFGSNYAVRQPLFVATICIYAALSSRELLLSKEPLPSRSAAAIGFLLSAIFYALPLALAGIDAEKYIATPGIGFWHGVISVKTMVFNVSISFLMLLQAKERVTLQYKLASITDGLTGLSNRTHFVSASTTALATNPSPQNPSSLLLFDIDRFKSINDEYGHLKGDEILTVFACVAKANLREGDILGRVGGEEFGALLHNCDVKNAVSIADGLREEFRRVCAPLLDGPFQASASAGIATTTTSTPRLKSSMPPLIWPSTAPNVPAAIERL